MAKHQLSKAKARRKTKAINAQRVAIARKPDPSVQHTRNQNSDQRDDRNDDGEEQTGTRLNLPKPSGDEDHSKDGAVGHEDVAIQGGTQERCALEDSDTVNPHSEFGEFEVFADDEMAEARMACGTPERGHLGRLSHSPRK